MGLGSVRRASDTEEMKYLAEARARKAAADDPLAAAGITMQEGSDGGGGGGFLDVLKKREAYREAFPEMLRTAAARRAQAGDPGQAGVHEATSMNNEAGFFAPFEFGHNDAPAQNYAPPGYIEAGHRRPEDYDPLHEAAYQQDYNYQQIGRPRRMA